MSRRFTEDQLKVIKDSDNVFCYANINSDLKMRVRGTVLSFNSLAELDNCLAQAFPEAEAEDWLDRHSRRPTKVCVYDITDLLAWRADNRNIYAGRYHPILGSPGFGNPYTVSKFGRNECLELYRQNTLRTLSVKQKTTIREARFVACHCQKDELSCHVTALIDFSCDWW